MASLRYRADHDRAASRRLDLLTAELAAIRPSSAVDPPAVDPPADEPWLAGHTRIRPLRAVPEPLPDPPSPPAREPPAAPVVPLPGRHAARRIGRPPGLRAGPVRARVVLGPSHLLVVAVLVATGLAIAAWWVIRSDPERLEAPGPMTPTAALPPHSAATPPSVAVRSSGVGDAPVVGTSPGTATVTVDVTGKVRRRGIVVLDAGARVVDAIDAAGGARRGVDLSPLNLARVLADGEQVVVGAPAGPPPAAGIGGGAPTAAPINLNTATQPDLESLPQVGPVTAEAILTWRSEHGRFTAVDELLEVDGIGAATLARIAPHVTV